MMMMEPGGGSSATAAAAMRSLAAVLARSRSVRPDSITASELAGTAPPCTRRMRPMRSRADRSRRTVSVVTENSSASSATETRPCWVMAWAMACWRSSAYTGAPSVGGRWDLDAERSGGVTPDHSSASMLFYPRIC